MHKEDLQKNMLLLLLCMSAILHQWWQGKVLLERDTVPWKWAGCSQLPQTSPELDYEGLEDGLKTQDNVTDTSQRYQNLWSSLPLWRPFFLGGLGWLNGILFWQVLPADGGISAGCKAKKMPPHPNKDVALFITVNLDRFTQQFWFHFSLSTVSQQGQDQNLYPCCIYGCWLCLVLKNTSGLALY